MLDTGDVSQKLKRGKHTTRHVEIFNAVNVSDDTFIADTPGFSMLELPQDVDCENLKDLFKDFSEYECNC
ncbi:GTPase RsgA, partial [Klebsiella pneumoniae]|uniref:GTPase RsgA n=1 Tax=Klebsiella pneumoniae TaxID=573 RepID=UPI0025A0F36C